MSTRRSVRFTIHKDEQRKGLLQSDRLDSFFFHRTTTRQRRAGTSSNTGGSILDGESPDFLRLLTAVQGLYSQKDVIDMQQLDGSSRNNIGSGAVFQVSTIDTESSQASETAENTTTQKKLSVILKRSPIPLFQTNGKTREGSETWHASASFVMELRILSHPHLREHQNVVSLLGVGWEYGRSEEAIPEPNLLLEKAFGTLEDFQKENPDLPLETRNNICLDVAMGLKALHSCGVIHGDVKPDNVLMFESDRWTAKVADFSHSLLDTGEDRYLPGGTELYAAPEWKKKLSSSQLYKTDIFSYGILLGSVMVGYDIAHHYLDHTQIVHGVTPEQRALSFSEKKRNDQLRDYAMGLVYDRNDTDLTARRDEISVIEKSLNLTLQVDPSKRNLDAVISELRVESKPLMERQVVNDTVFSRLDQNILAVPYQALANKSNVLKRMVVRSLEDLAGNKDDDRSKAACWELCACYMSGFGVPLNDATASYWLIQAAERGEPWARSAAHRLLQATNKSELVTPETLETWLIEAAEKGSWMALQSLQQLSSSKFGLAFSLHRKFIQKSVTNRYDKTKGRSLEILAEDIVENSTGQSERNEPSKFIAETDIHGDTPLMRACRAGDVDLINKFLEDGIEANQTNRDGENCLHVLSCIENENVHLIAEKLFRAGIDWTHEAQGSSLHITKDPLDFQPFIPGCPITRAVVLNKPDLVHTLLRLEKEFQEQLTARREKIRLSNIRKLIALACKFNYPDILEAIRQNKPEAFQSQSLNRIGYWNHGRRFSLPALAISGFASENDGFDLPDRFWRSLNNGFLHTQNLVSTLEFLRSAGVNFYDTNCAGERNVLFFAIRQGRIDAVEYLLKEVNAENPFKIFGSQHLSRGRFWPQATPAPIPSYPNHRHKMGLTDAVKLSITNGHLEIFQILITWNDAEALNPGALIPLEEVPRSYFGDKWQYNVRIPGEIKDLRIFFPYTMYNQFSDEIWTDDPEGLQKSKDLPWPTEATSRYTWTIDYPIQKSKQVDNHNCIFDGRLNYGLLFMTVIASSTHRDIDFAVVLIHSLLQLSPHEPLVWVTRSGFEQASIPEVECLPLVRAANVKWISLAKLLLENGADIRDQGCGFSPSYLQIYGGSRNFPILWERLDYNWIGDLMRYHTRLEEYQAEISLNIVTATILLNLSYAVDSCQKPPTTDEFNHLIHITQLIGHEIVDELDSLWTSIISIHKKFQVKMNMKDAAELIIKASSNQRCLKYMLQMELDCNAGWLHRLWKTPVDLVHERLLVYLRDSNDIKCLEILRDYGAQRGLFYTLEFQALVTAFMWLCFFGVLASTYFSFNLVNKCGYSTILHYIRGFHLLPGLRIPTNTPAVTPFSYFPDIHRMANLIFPLATYNLRHQMRVGRLPGWKYRRPGYRIAEDVLFEDVIAMLHGPTISFLRKLNYIFKAKPEESKKQGQIESRDNPEEPKLDETIVSEITNVDDSYTRKKSTRDDIKQLTDVESQLDANDAKDYRNASSHDI